MPKVTGRGQYKPREAIRARERAKGQRAGRGRGGGRRTRYSWASSTRSIFFYNPVFSTALFCVSPAHCHLRQRRRGGGHETHGTCDRKPIPGTTFCSCLGIPSWMRLTSCAHDWCRIFSNPTHISSIGLRDRNAIQYRTRPLSPHRGAIVFRLFHSTTVRVLKSYQSRSIFGRALEEIFFRKQS